MERLHTHIKHAHIIFKDKPNIPNIPEDYTPCIVCGIDVTLDFDNIYSFEKKQWFKTGVTISRKEARDHIIKQLKPDSHYIHMFDKIDDNSCYLGILIRGEFKRYWIKDSKKVLTLCDAKFDNLLFSKGSWYYDPSITEYNQELFDSLVVECYDNMKLEYQLVIKKYINTIPDREELYERQRQQTIAQNSWGKNTALIVSRTKKDMKQEASI
jgi:hypothetical protein